LTVTSKGSSARARVSESSGKARTATFAAKGEYWTLSHAGATVSIKDVKGFGYIQRLLQHPGEEFHSLDLLHELPAPSNTSGDNRFSTKGEGIDSVGGLGDAGEMLDRQARSEYQRRYRELNDELEDLREKGKHQQAEKVESELEFLRRELARAIGLGGRDRRAGSAAERARLNVTRAIRAALQKISEQHPGFAELLDRSIRTGAFCSYKPDLTQPVIWKFSIEDTETPAQIAAEPVLSPRDTDFLRAYTRGTTFVGRDSERAMLVRGLEQAQGGRGKIVLISGAAGVGKTRISAEVAAEASRREMLTYLGCCYDREDPVPFNPFVEILESALAGIRDPEALRLALGNNGPEIARLVPQLRRSFPDIPAPAELSPEQSRRALFGAVTQLLTRVSHNTPALFLIDDIQWADEGTLLLFNHLAHFVPALPVMIVATLRDFELIPREELLMKTLEELFRHHRIERITLGGLPEKGVREMLAALSGREPPETIVQLFCSNTDGNPFFIEELFRHLIEQNKLIDSAGEFRSDLKLGDFDVPQSLRLRIGSRLARLGDATLKALGAAAAIGRSFTFELLTASTRADPDSLLDSVEEAEKAGLITSTLDYPDALFRFSHELIRQAVIARLSPARRQRIHLDIADAIESLFANSLEDRVNDLAHHLYQAGTAADGRRTARFLAMAARRALQQGALTEGEGFYQQALDVLQTTAESPDRDQQELEIQLAIGQVFIATRGYTAAETASAYDRASALGERLGEPIQIVLALGGLYGLSLLRGDMDGAQAFADRVRAIADRCGSSATRAWGCHYQGVPSYHHGRLAAAQDYFSQALAAYREDDHQNNPQDPGVESLAYMSVTEWQLGMADSARARIREALQLADRLRKPYVTAYSRFFAAYLHALLRDPVNCQRFSEEFLEHSTGQSLPFIFDICRILRGWALAQQGRYDEGISNAREGLADFKAKDNGLSIGSFTGFLAESFAQGGKLDEALVKVDEGIAALREQLVDLPYLLWLRGELLLQQSPGLVESAEHSFRESIALANRAGAKSYALRSATSLARLLSSRGHASEARELLSPLYSSFVEGFDTRDLIEARNVVRQIGNAESEQTTR
jgi:tetratricopeptide (TPR) repeat protein